MSAESIDRQAPITDRVRRSLVNKMAQRLAADFYNEAKQRLQDELDMAEMRCSDDALLANWQHRVNCSLLDYARG